MSKAKPKRGSTKNALLWKPVLGVEVLMLFHCSPVQALAPDVLLYVAGFQTASPKLSLGTQLPMCSNLRPPVSVSLRLAFHWSLMKNEYCVYRSEERRVGKECRS